MKENFFKYQAQTTNNPISLEILRASGSYIYDTNNNKYLDFVAGVSSYMTIEKDGYKKGENQIAQADAFLSNNSRIIFHLLKIILN